MNKFKKGDKVKVVDGNHNIPLGSIWEVKESTYDFDDVDEFLALVGCKLTEDEAGWSASRFELAEADIAKPILEERKIGKIKMQLFDEGFPNAVMEIAKVMGWAEQNKGYKPNDFKNLPNADVEFSAAASRHKLKGLIQKDAGLPPLERVDEESGIVHLAHAAFNILAELELVLTGRIKE